MHPELYLLDWFESLKRYGSKPGLQLVRELLSLMGSPQESFDSIHVTGTNGKGSTTAMTASILEKAGYKVGVFTSPHLSRINESIKVNGKDITDTEMNNLLAQIKDQIQHMLETGTRHPTYFEVLVVLAYSYFQLQGVEIAVIEVGMGGRDDATNVLNSMASIVTNISLEHTQWLGDTLEEIAENKAGILNENSALITAANQPEVIAALREIAEEKHSGLIRVDEDYRVSPENKSLAGQEFTIETPERTLTHLRTPLLGDHQLRNAACAIAAINVSKKNGYKITEDAIREGLAEVIWPGRFEVMEEHLLIILDGAKDAEAINALVETVKTYLPDRHVITILGTSSDKANKTMIEALSEVTDQFILTEHRINNRTTRAIDLEKIATKTGKPTMIVTPVSEAIKMAKKMANPDDVILVTGSVFLIGEAREYWF
jgi:dihydrofolate synthase/folylpolyglutamate synthase